MTLPVRKHTRAAWHNYEEGWYFITFCTERHRTYFGTAKGTTCQLNKIGKHVSQSIPEIIGSTEGIILDSYVVMPNHVHIIICVGHAVILPKTFGSQIRNYFDEKHGATAVAKTVGKLKALLRREILPQCPGFKWQSNYHDRIIRNIEEFDSFRSYISDNPDNWASDCYHTP